MMDNKAIQDAVESVIQKVDEIKKLYVELQTLKKYGADIDLPDLESLFTGNGTNGISADVSIRPDEFIGMSNTEAADKYLKKVGHAVLFEDIYNALSEGGIKFTSNGRTVLNNQLTRATLKFVKMGKGHKISFGLLEFYPRLQKQRLSRPTQEVVSNGTDDQEEVKEEQLPEEGMIEESTTVEQVKSRRTIN